jgi:hypothetical protein
VNPGAPNGGPPGGYGPPPGPGPYAGNPYADGGGMPYPPRQELPAPQAGSYYGSGSRPHLSVVRSGMNRQPFVNPELRTCIESWHKGKGFRHEGKIVNGTWRALFLVDCDREYVVLTRDDLDPGIDDEDLVNEVWQKIVSYTNGLGDGMPHHSRVECHFSHECGWQGADVWTGNLMLPTSTAGYGDAGSGSMGGGYYGYGGAPQSLAAPQSFMATVHKDRIDVMAIALNMMREAGGFMMDTMRELRVQVQRYQDREGQFIEMWQDAEDRKSKRAIEATESAYKLRAMDLLVGRLSAILPVVGLKLSRWITSKMSDGEAKRTPREERAYATLKGLIESFQKSGVAPNAEALVNHLNMMGVTGDLQRDLMELIEEFVVEEQRKKLESESKSLTAFSGTGILDEYGRVKGLLPQEGGQPIALLEEPKKDEK